jgi:rhomboid-like protein
VNDRRQEIRSRADSHLASATPTRIHHSRCASRLRCRRASSMSLSRIGRPALQRLCLTSQRPATPSLRWSAHSLNNRLQQRSQHNSERPPRRSERPSNRKSPVQQIKEEQIEIIPPIAGSYSNPASGDQYSGPGYEEDEAPKPEWPRVRVRYLRPAIWSLTVSAGIFSGLAYYQARKEVEAEKKASKWLQAPQWGLPQSRAGPPSATELATQWWKDQNPISKATWYIIGANSAVHLTSFLVPRYWDLLWHIPARNVNYTNFTSMFVHSGPMHLAVNMWATYNFMLPVGYSRLFEGNAAHVGAFFLATGVLSGYAQHFTTMFTKNRRIIPEIFIRGGGASGALFGILGAFCMEYPHAQLGILFLPVSFEAQYFFPAVMLFDLVGVIRGYSFVNFGHAVSCFVENDVCAC